MLFIQWLARLTAFALSSSDKAPPLAEIGVEAPMTLSGAMAATSAARVMKAPAEAAHDPLGT